MSCRALVDAGARWAVTTLESDRLVSRSAPVDPAAVLAARAYWEPAADATSDWLNLDVLPKVRSFLQEHAKHELRFGDEDEIMGTQDAAFLDWLDLSEAPIATPRYFAEVLGLASWAQVEEHVESQATQPWWWSLDPVKELTRARFNQLNNASYPAVESRSRVGSFPAEAKAGGGYVWDAVLEYRVWCHPDEGAADLYKGEDYFYPFETYEEALAFSQQTKGAEEPLALIRQDEYIDEPEPGRFVHVRETRIAEWPVEFLNRPRRSQSTIPNFLSPNAPANRLDIIRGLVK
jgi:putative acetyltransferase